MNDLMAMKRSQILAATMLFMSPLGGQMIGFDATCACVVGVLPFSILILVAGEQVQMGTCVCTCAGN